jgi:hypothetical protein
VLEERLEKMGKHLKTKKTPISKRRRERWKKKIKEW